MRIKQIEIFKSRIKLKESFVISLGSFDYAENVIIKISVDNGLKGFGECSPFMTIHGESIETCYVIAGLLAKFLIGKDPLDLEGCTALMDKIIYGNASIKSAFDMALYDIASRFANLPLYAFLGGKNNKIITTDYTVSLGDPQKMSVDALKIKEQGFEVIKVKLGETKERDVERIRLIREAVGTEITLRIDANQGWDVEEAIRILNALEPFKIEFCEEPIPRWEFMQLSRIREKSPIPIMADESCCDHHDAKRLIDIKACDFLNIKLGKSSGIYKALQMIRLAEKANMKIQIGGFLESRLGFTASAHLALTSKNIVYFDFDTPLMFAEDYVEGGISYDNKGRITIPDNLGLGASINEDYLEGLTKCLIN